MTTGHGLAMSAPSLTRSGSKEKKGKKEQEKKKDPNAKLEFEKMRTEN